MIYKLMIFKNGNKPTINGVTIPDNIAEEFSMIDMELNFEDNDIIVYIISENDGENIISRIENS